MLVVWYSWFTLCSVKRSFQWVYEGEQERERDRESLVKWTWWGQCPRPWLGRGDSIVGGPIPRLASGTVRPTTSVSIRFHVPGWKRKWKRVWERGREGESLSGIKCHTYCEISLIKKWFGVVIGCTQRGWNGPWNALVSDGSLHWSAIKTFILSRRKTVRLIHLLSVAQHSWKGWIRRKDFLSFPQKNIALKNVSFISSHSWKWCTRFL